MKWNMIFHFEISLSLLLFTISGFSQTYPIKFNLPVDVFPSQVDC